MLTFEVKPNSFKAYQTLSLHFFLLNHTSPNGFCECVLLLSGFPILFPFLLDAAGIPH